jgi:hypothetical protein
MKFVIKETKETCVILETFTDLFGNEMVRIRTDSGQIMEVAKSDVVQFLQD